MNNEQPEIEDKAATYESPCIEETAQFESLSLACGLDNGVGACDFDVGTPSQVS